MRVAQTRRDGGRPADGAPPRLVLVGGSGFVGTATALTSVAQGRATTVVDRSEPNPRIAGSVQFEATDLLDTDLELPDGEIVLLAGTGQPRARRPERLPLDVVAPTVALRHHLAGRRTVLVSSLEVYGSAPGPLGEDTPAQLPWSDDRLADWARRLEALLPDAPPQRLQDWADELAVADPGGRWRYAMSKRAQELVARDAVGDDDLVVLRLANTVGPGQERVVARLARRAATGRPLEVTARTRRSFVPVGHVAAVITSGVRAGTYVVGSPSILLEDLAALVLESVGSASDLLLTPPPAQDSCGEVAGTALDDLGLGVAPVEEWIAAAVKDLLDDGGPVAHPPLGVVVPPRLVDPARVARRHAAVLATGALKSGQRFSSELVAALRGELALGEDQQLLATTSGTDALRILVGATIGPAKPGDVVVVPSFTFPATLEVPRQLGYRLRFADVDERTWTLDPDSVEAALASGDVAAVITVDTFGHPSAYGALRAQCERAGVQLLGDSAASFGSRLDGRPVAGLADGHAYSMSFAKVLSAGGAGGAVVLPATLELGTPHGWTRSALMNELHAVVALDQLAVLDDLVRRRELVAQLYSATCARLGLDHQRVAPGVRHSWVHFVVRVPGGAQRRRLLGDRLAQLGVGTKPYFDALHLVPTSDQRVDLPVTERLASEVLALPMSSELTVEDAELVCVALERALT